MLTQSVEFLNHEWSSKSWSFLIRIPGVFNKHMLDNSNNTNNSTQTE